MIKTMEADGENLMAVFKHGMGLQKALDAASEILGNPIMIFDIAYNLVACTENTVTDDYLWNELTALGKFTHESVDFFNKEKFVEQYAESDVVTFMHSDKLKYDRVNAKLFDKDGIQIANIIVVACYRNLVEQDLILLESISEIISAELCDREIYQSMKRGFSKSIVDDLLEGNAVDGVEEENAMRSLYTDLKTNLYVAVVDIVQYEPTLTHLVYFRDLFTKMQKEYKYFVYLNNIVIIISTNNNTLIVKKDLRKLNGFFKKYNIYAGISDCFQNIYDLQKHYKRALNALNYGTSSKCVRHVFRYDDFRLDYFLGSVMGDTDIRELYNPLVPLIKKYDERRGTAYFDTIYAYLLAGGNAASALSVLEINNAELCMRLEEITDIFGVDWSDGNMLYSIFMSIKLLEPPFGLKNACSGS